MNFGFVIEGVVAALLLVTIAYCIMLDRRLKTLKADEQSFKIVVGELVAATDAAERAVAGLKVTVQDAEYALTDKLRSAERFTLEIERQMQAGEALLARLSRVAFAGRGLPDPGETPTTTDPRAMAAAAQAIADRARLRAHGLAA